MDNVRTQYVMLAFITGWTKGWKLAPSVMDGLDLVGDESDDMFRRVVMYNVEGRMEEQFNRSIAELFGEVVTQVKTFPTGNGSWIILDKHTKRLLHKDVKNENEVDYLCKKHGYLR